MGNKWTTTVNCSSPRHALWLIRSQWERFSGAAPLRITLALDFCFEGTSDYWAHYKNDIERARLRSVFSRLVVEKEKKYLFAEFLPRAHASPPGCLLWGVPLQPQASEVMRNVDLILSSSSHYFWESGQGSRKRNLCFSHSGANKRGLGLGEAYTHTTCN